MERNKICEISHFVPEHKSKGKAPHRNKTHIIERDKKTIWEAVATRMRNGEILYKGRSVWNNKEIILA